MPAPRSVSPLSAWLNKGKDCGYGSLLFDFVTYDATDCGATQGTYGATTG
jgi:hypothetical protein